MYREKMNEELRRVIESIMKKQDNSKKSSLSTLLYVYHSVQFNIKAYRWWDNKNPDILWKEIQYLPLKFSSSYIPHHCPLIYNNTQYKLTLEQELLWNAYATASDSLLSTPEVLKLYQDQMKDTVAIESFDKVDITQYRAKLREMYPSFLSQYVITDKRLRKLKCKNPIHPILRRVKNEILFNVLFFLDSDFQTPPIEEEIRLNGSLETIFPPASQGHNWNTIMVDPQRSELMDCVDNTYLWKYDGKDLVLKNDINSRDYFDTVRAFRGGYSSFKFLIASGITNPSLPPR